MRSELSSWSVIHKEACKPNDVTRVPSLADAVGECVAFDCSLLGLFRFQSQGARVNDDLQHHYSRRKQRSIWYPIGVITLHLRRWSCPRRLEKLYILFCQLLGSVYVFRHEVDSISVARRNREHNELEELLYPMASVDRAEFDRGINGFCSLSITSSDTSMPYGPSFLHYRVNLGYDLSIKVELVHMNTKLGTGL